MLQKRNNAMKRRLSCALLLYYHLIKKQRWDAVTVYYWNETHLLYVFYVP